MSSSINFTATAGVVSAPTRVMRACERGLAHEINAIFNSRPLGDVSPMNDQAILELRQAFFGE